jgi:hypothetical protein
MDDLDSTPETQADGSLAPPPPKPPTAVATMSPAPAPERQPHTRKRRGLATELGETFRLAVDTAFDALDRMGDAIAEATGLRQP